MVTLLPIEAAPLAMMNAATILSKSFEKENHGLAGPDILWKETFV
jgi:hypothetical protein